VGCASMNLGAKNVSDYELLTLIKQGKTAAQIARTKDATRQAIGKRIKKLQERGFIKLDKVGTQYARDLHCSNEKIYMLTSKGKAYMQQLQDPRFSGGGPLSLSNLRVCIKNITPQAEKHNFRIKAEILERGTYPPQSKMYKMKNWDKIYGYYMDSRYEIMPRSVLVFLKAHGKNSKEVSEKLWAKLEAFVVYFYHLGWSFDKIRATNNGKAGVIGVIYNAPPQKGKLGEIDRTPKEMTIHPKDESDVDTLIESSRWIDRNLNDLEDLLSKYRNGNLVIKTPDDDKSTTVSKSGGDRT